MRNLQPHTLAYAVRDFCRYHSVLWSSTLWYLQLATEKDLLYVHSESSEAVTIDRGAKQIVGAGTATATEPTREHRQYATQGPTTYLCTNASNN